MGEKSPRVNCKLTVRLRFAAPVGYALRHMAVRLLALFSFLLLSVRSAAALPACDDSSARDRCGSWTLGGYYSFSPQGDWFSGVSAGMEYFVLPEFSLAPSLSPGLSPGYFYLSPSIDASYYLWRNDAVELGLGYAVRYFYQWPLSAANAESSGTMHGPGAFAVFSVTRQFYAGLSLSYQFVRFEGELYREWYFTVPVYWYF